MSSPIAAECFHGTISCDEAEARLRGNGKDRDRSYLTRRFETKAGSYVLSYIVETGADDVLCKIHNPVRYMLKFVLC